MYREHIHRTMYSFHLLYLTCLLCYSAWDLVAILMELGEKAVVTAAPRFAYGAEGR